MAQVRERLDHHTRLFDQYQAAIKQARQEGYRQQELVRSEATLKRSEALNEARRRAESMTGEARTSIREQVEAAKVQLDREARSLAQSIAASILKRPA